MIVMKFGGTSVQDVDAIENVIEIIRGRLDRRPVVVVSAMARVTDTLLLAARTAKDRQYDMAEALLDQLQERHVTVAEQLLSQTRRIALDPPLSESKVREQICKMIYDLKGLVRSVATLGELTPRSQDAVVSFGERLSSLIIAAALRARGIEADLADSRQFLVTDDHFTSAAPDMIETEKRARAELLPIIESGRVPVAQGFIGSTAEGVTTTIGRGGGDYSAAIIGSALGADSIEIWTDVDGLMTADPRVIPDARRIRVISFSEAAELSYFGAKVLHPSTVLPAVEKGIPVHIYNTRNPSCEGTRIVARPQPSRNLIKSIAFKRG
ncbi:MAG: aspartate kinase, partial [Acidobacteriota bacterium]